MRLSLGSSTPQHSILSILFKSFFVINAVHFFAHPFISIQRCDTIFGFISLRVFIFACVGNFVRHDTLFGDGIEPERSRFQLPIVGVVLANRNLLVYLLIQNSVAILPSHCFEKVRLFGVFCSLCFLLCSNLRQVLFGQKLHIQFHLPRSFVRINHSS